LRRIGLIWRSSASAKRRDFEALAKVVRKSAAGLLGRAAE